MEGWDICPHIIMMSGDKHRKKVWDLRDCAPIPANDPKPKIQSYGFKMKVLNFSFRAGAQNFGCSNFPAKGANSTFQGARSTFQGTALRNKCFAWWLPEYKATVCWSQSYCVVFLSSSCSFKLTTWHEHDVRWHDVIVAACVVAVV